MLSIIVYDKTQQFGEYIVFSGVSVLKFHGKERDIKGRSVIIDLSESYPSDDRRPL